MTENKIEVEYITTVAGALQAVEKLNKRLDQQEQKLQRVGDTSKKTADGAVNSFAKLEQTLKLNEKALQNMSVGSIEFDKQLQKVNRLREAHKKMRDTIQGGGQQSQGVSAKAAKGSIEDVGSQLKAVEAQLRRTASGTAEFAKLEQVVSRLRGKYGELTASMQQLGVVQKAVIPQAAGSFNAIETQLREAEQALRGLTAGTKQFVEQTQTVKRLREEHSRLKDAMLGVRTVRGSFEELEQSLRDNEAALRRMTIGSKAFTEQKKKVDDLRKSLAGAKGELATMAEATGGGLSEAMGKVSQLAAGMLSFQAIVSAIVDELDTVRRLRVEASGATRSVEQSIAKMAVNIGADKVGAARAMIEENAPVLGVKQEGLANLFAAAISGGAKDLNEALQLSALTLKLTAGDAQQAAPIMSGMLSLSATTGNRDFQSVLGQLTQFQEAARGEDLAVSINNMSTAMAAANAKGERVAAMGGERTLEMSSVISQILQDPRMAVTGTTLRQMTQKMDSFIPKASATLDDGTKSRLSKGEIESFNKLDTVDARMQAMRQNPELRNQFLSTIENNEGKVAIRELVTGTKNVLELEAAAARIVTPIDKATESFTNLVSVIDENTQLLQASNKQEAQLQVADTTGTRRFEGQAIETVDNALRKMDVSGLNADTVTKIKWGMDASMASGMSAPEAGIAALEEAKQRRTLFGVVPVGGAVSAEDTQKADEAIQILRTMQALLEAQQAKPTVVRAPATRPKEAPLPAATAP